MSIVGHLAERGLIQAPGWLAANTAYETIMGSEAYGVASDASDKDIYGFCLPPKEMVFPHLAGEIPGFGKPLERFEQFQQHHITDKERGGVTYDITIYSIVKYFQLCMENNPNLIDSLYTPRYCVRHSSPIGEMVRERRGDFLHKGAWPKFKGYAYAQMHKIDLKEPKGKRLELVERHGYDCYDEATTEFLTNRGWQRFDEISDSDLVAAIDIQSGQVVFEKPCSRVDKLYSGLMYTVEPYLTRCRVTEGHQMLVSPCHRGTRQGYNHFRENEQWQLLPFSSIAAGRRSWFHVRCSAVGRAAELEVDDAYLTLAGLFIAEGSISFRNERIESARITQTYKGKPGFFAAADSLIDTFGLHKYSYPKETIWTVPRGASERLCNDFGHGSKMRSLPNWCLLLSKRQAKILWDHAVLGDGTDAPAGAQVYYTSSEALADDIQAMMVSAGWPCTKRGAYQYSRHIGIHGGAAPPMWQVYLSADDHPRALDFRSPSRVLRCGALPTRRNHPIKENRVEGQRVVCFEMPSGTLVTRNAGAPAFHGNCKFAYHVVRLLSEVEQILAERTLDLQRNREQLKAVRRGDWTLPQLKEYFAAKEQQLEALYHASTLPAVPDEARLKQLLIDCLEHHYGDLSKAVVKVDRADAALRGVKSIIDKYYAEQ